MTTPSSNNHRRKIIRLPNYNYAQDGAYFITIVTHNRKCLFGSIREGKMELNQAGKMVENTFIEIPNFITGVKFDPYQVMPNHIHAIVLIQRDPGRPQRGAPTENVIALTDIMGRFKSLTTRRYGSGVRKHGWRKYEGQLWQRSFYERVIRNEREHQAVVDYILANPTNWARDKNYCG